MREVWTRVLPVGLEGSDRWFGLGDGAQMQGDERGRHGRYSTEMSRFAEDE